MKQDGGLFCLDWEAAQIELWGEKGSLDFSQLDVMAIPCHLRYELAGNNTYKDAIAYDDCNWDRDATIEYLTKGSSGRDISVDIVIYYN